MKNINCKDFKTNEEMLGTVLYSIKCNEHVLANLCPSNTYLGLMGGIELNKSNLISLLITSKKGERQTFYALKKQILEFIEKFIDRSLDVLNEYSKEEKK